MILQHRYCTIPNPIKHGIYDLVIWSSKSLECHLKVKKHKEAISDALNCLNLNPDNPESLKILSLSHYEIGTIKLSHGNLQDALNEFTNSINYYSTDPKPFIYRARVYEHLKVIFINLGSGDW